jgi:quinoprotein dehydrogenase-associated probable ABC transporter substrate-binding protein
MLARHFRLSIALAAAGAFVSLTAAAQQAPDTVSRADLRVCADPHNLPFSNDKGEGFENKIAELIAHELNEKLAYTWFPDSQGFVRATLGRNSCDVIIGTAVGNSDVATTAAYYHTAYMMVTRSADNYAMDKVSDWHIAGKRFGLVASTPPTNLIVLHNLMDQTSIYQLMVDTRVDQPAHDMLKDLVSGRIDVGLLWGPIAGYYTKHDALPLKLVFLDPEDSKVRLDYHIAMGVRPSDTAFRRRLNQAIAKDQPQITQIMRDFGVPLLDEQNRPLPAAP